MIAIYCIGVVLGLMASGALISSNEYDGLAPIVFLSSFLWPVALPVFLLVFLGFVVASEIHDRRKKQ